MSIKSLGNLPTSYNDYLANTGTEASYNVKINSSGGTIIVSGTSVYHVFTGGGNLNVLTGPITADILIVAAGGGGAGGQGGGGGAGGVVYGPAIPLSNGSYPISIGTEGTGGSGTAGSGTQGSPSSFDAITAVGGGGGIRNNYGYPSPESPIAAGGSSGGAGGGGLTSGPSSTPVTPQPVPVSYTAYGNVGGNQQNVGGGAGSGGGGAGAAGNPGGSNPGAGGNGQPFPSFPGPILAPAIPAPARVEWAAAVGPTGLFGGGGGGGGSTTNPVPNPNAGPGGGGNGATNPGGAGVSFTGGGGGASFYPPEGVGGDGGKGIVIVRYTSSNI